LGIKEGGKVIGEMLKGNSVLGELDLSGNSVYSKISPKFAVALSTGLAKNGELTVLNLASNNLGARVLPEGWSKGSGKHDAHGSFWYRHANGTEQKTHPGEKPEGVIALANAIPDMRAMTKFDISSNNIRAEGCEALAAGLKGNQVITELNISSNRLGLQHYSGGSSGVLAIADAISGMGALTKLTFGDRQVVTMTTKMTEANFGGKLKFYEYRIVVAFLPKCT
jgi:Ran GTPase-activating protein (RanGAP) involved in mRNA processing and transport